MGGLGGGVGWGENHGISFFSELNLYFFQVTISLSVDSESKQTTNNAGYEIVSNESEISPSAGKLC